MVVLLEKRANNPFTNKVTSLSFFIASHKECLEDICLQQMLQTAFGSSLPSAGYLPLLFQAQELTTSHSSRETQL